MSKKILVVGGAGYIGSHVQKQLIEDGFEVIVYDNLSSGHKSNIFAKAKFIEGDILDKKALNKAMQGVDGVVHLAAKKAVGESMEKPEVYAENNLTGALNILNAMVENGVKYIVFSSSAAVYGMPQYVPIDENHPINPINYYGYTKRCIEENMDWFSKLGKINYASLRYFNAVGYASDGSIRAKERNPQNLMPIIMDVASGRREGFSIFGNDYDTPDGTGVRDYIHVVDLARGHVKALNKVKENAGLKIYNLGTGHGVSVLQLVHAFEKANNLTIPYKVFERRAGDIAEFYADASKAERELHWKASRTIEDMCRDAWNWQKQNPQGYEE